MSTAGAPKELSGAIPTVPEVLGSLSVLPGHPGVLKEAGTFRWGESWLALTHLWAKE